MADVTISQLPAGTPSSSAFIPFSDGGVTKQVAPGILLANAGNVGIGTTSPDAKLNVVGSTLNSNSGLNQYRDVISAYLGSSSQVGTLKITLPRSRSSTMLHIVIRGYDYSSYGAWELMLGGYNYGGDNNWYNYNAVLIGQAPFNRVRFAREGSNDVILLGVTSTSWSYATIAISNVITTYVNLGSWGSGWGLGLITNESAITNVFEPTLASTSQGNPVGTIITYAGNSAPGGYLICDGSTVPNGIGTVQGITTNFSNLYGIIGSIYGSAGKIPDLRGQFVRGWDSGRGIDPSRVFGSNQGDQIKAIPSVSLSVSYGGSNGYTSTRGYWAPSSTSCYPVGAGSSQSYDSSGGNGPGRAGGFWGINLTGTAGSETRPTNVALAYIIKY